MIDKGLNRSLRNTPADRPEGAAEFVNPWAECWGSLVRCPSSAQMHADAAAPRLAPAQMAGFGMSSRIGAVRSETTQPYSSRQSIAGDVAQASSDQPVCAQSPTDVPTSSEQSASPQVSVETGTYPTAVDQDLVPQEFASKEPVRQDMAYEDRAPEELSTETCVVERVLPVINNKGLHARASAKFVQTVEAFDAVVTVSRGGETVGGLSIMGLMMLAAARGTEIAVEARGREAVQAMAAIEALLASKFGEEC